MTISFSSASTTKAKTATISDPNSGIHVGLLFGTTLQNHYLS